MKTLLLFLFFGMTALSAAEIFVNGNFQTNRRSEPLLWSRIIGFNPSKPHGKLSVEQGDDKKNILHLSAFEREAIIHSTRPARCSAGDVFTLRFKERGNGILKYGYSAYSHSSDNRFGGSELFRTEAGNTWKEIEKKFTIRNFNNKETAEIRLMLLVSPSSNLEISDLRLEKETPEKTAFGNSSFEYGNVAADGLFPWSWQNSFGNVKIDSQTAYDGKRSLLLDGDAAGRKTEHAAYFSKYVGAYQTFAVKSNTVYTISAWTKCKLESGYAGVAVMLLNESGTQVNSNIPPLKYMVLDKTRNSDAWKRISYTFKTPDKCAMVRVYAVSENLTGKVWFDGMKISDQIDTPSVPSFTGKLTEETWKNAVTFDDFIKVGDANSNSRDFLKTVEPAVPKTSLKILTDNKRLYFRIDCFEPEMKQRLIRASGRDGKAYNDDSVEIFIDAVRDRQNFYQIGINSAGAVYDANGNNPKWSPSSLSVRTQDFPSFWRIDMGIDFIDLGYGEGECMSPNKKMGLAVFRNRMRKNQPVERSTFLQWPWPVYQDASRYCPIEVGVSNAKGEKISFLLSGMDSPYAMRPAQAWKMESPLYEELLDPNDKLNPDPALVVADVNIGRMISANQNWNSTAFALQRGVRYHYSEIAALNKAMRVSTEMTGAFSKNTFTSKAVEKYKIPVMWYLVPQLSGKLDKNIPGIIPDPKRPYYRYQFLPDPRVSEAYLADMTREFAKVMDHVAVVPLGHESHGMYFRYYDLFREAYLKQAPEVWKGFEDEARTAYGFGKYGFPKSAASATPYERMVFQKWFLEKYNQCMAKVAKALKKLKPSVILLSDVERGHFSAMLYENAKGTYDYITSQQQAGGGEFRQQVAFGVKFMRDVYDTPVRGAPHVEHYYGSLNEEEVNEVLSSIFRAGGSSMSLWLVDWAGKTYNDYYGSPKRFHEIVNICKHLSSMGKIRFPKPDTAVFFSNNTRFAENWWFEKTSDPNGEEYESIFTVLGPHAGSNFKFISETGVLAGDAALSDFKAIYVPSARYQDKETFEKLVDYARKGGTLILASPDEFLHSPDGVDRNSVRKEVMGISVSRKISNPGSFRFNVKSGDGTFASLAGLSAASFANTAYQMTPLKQTKVLASFDNGMPALTLHPLGKGRVLTFAVSPFNSNLFTSAPHWKIFKALQKELGAATDSKVWRFKFPMAKEEPAEPWPPKMECLTNNAFQWEYDSIVEGPNNGKLDSASYSLSPDFIPDPAKNCGALFNRRASLDLEQVKRKKNPEVLPGWAAAWKNPAPFDITLKFKEKVTPSVVKIWCHGDIPEITVSAETNGTYVVLGKSTLPGSAELEVDVREIEIKLKGVKTDSLRLSFGQRKNLFHIGEVEVWQAR